MPERFLNLARSGASSLRNWLWNLPDDGEIYTLDLPDEQLNTQYSTDPEDAQPIAVESGKGSLCAGIIAPAHHISKIRLGQVR